MKGYRTIAVNVALAILGALQAFDWVTVVPQEYVGLTVLVITMLNVGLRTVTTTPVGRR